MMIAETKPTPRESDLVFASITDLAVQKPSALGNMKVHVPKPAMIRPTARRAMVLEAS